MTKNVLISVKGLQAADENDHAEPVEVVTVGEYYYRNGHHFLRYEEPQEGTAETTVTYLKADGKSMEVRKKGFTNVHMLFQEEKKNVTYYETPFGSIQMGISATKVTCRETNDHINIHVDYALEMNEEHVADCFVQVEVQPTENFQLS
jgi:uncharacterized beta-barrel protein YwiB (DUF1934 family)